MALFLRNICKFDGCGIIFPSLNELIEHIERCHIDFDPEVMEQEELEKPECVPLSYIIRYSYDDTEKQDSSISLSPMSSEKQTALEHHNYSLSFLNNIGSDSEIDDLASANNLNDIDDYDLDEEFSSEFIMRYGSRQCIDDNNKKPFACPVPGCKKRYKNVNGIKYHAKNGHKKNSKLNKGLKCHCGKMYKTAHGLKNHVFTTHSNGEIILPSTSSLPQPLDSLSLLTISRLPNNFDGLYENAYECPQQPINNINPGNCSNIDMHTDMLSSNRLTTSVVFEEKAETNDEIKGHYSNNTSSMTAVPARSKQNDDIIDVGDVNDCIYS